MNRAILLLLLSLWVGKGSYCQQITTKVLENASRFPYVKVIGAQGGTQVLLRSATVFKAKQKQIHIRENSLNLLGLDSALNQVWTIPVDISNYTAPEIEDVLLTDHSLVVLFSALSKESSFCVLKALQYELKGGNQLGSIVDLDSVRYDKRRSRASFYTALNKDHSKLLLFFRQKKDGTDDFNHGETSSANADEELCFRWFNSDLVKETHQNYPNVDFAGEQSVEEAILDENGTAIALLKYKSSTRSTSGNYDLLAISANSDSLKHRHIAVDGKNLNDLKLSIDYQQDLVQLCGFYAGENSLASVGVLFGTYNPRNDSLTGPFLQEFKAKTINDFMANKENGKINDLFNYKVDRLIPRSDGGTILIAEASYVTETQSYNSYYQLYTVTYSYHFDNVLLFSLNPDGTIDWTCVLRKNQVSENDEGFYSSYSLYVAEQELSICYNKAIRRRADIARFNVNFKGHSTSETLIENANEVLIMPQGSKQVSAKEILIPCSQKNSPAILKLLF